MRRLRDLKRRNDSPENLTEGVFTSDFIDYMNVDVFDEELEEGELVLEQEETEEDVDNDVAFNIIDSKYRDELRTWLEQYLFAQRRYEDEMDKYKDSSQEELDNISQNIEFAFSKIKWILEEILQIFKLYGLAYGNEYTNWFFEGEYTAEGRYLEPYDNTLVVPISLVPWLIDMLDGEIDPAWERWSYITKGKVDRYGRDNEDYGF